MREIDTFHTNSPVCPHCGHELDDDEMSHTKTGSDVDLWALAPREETAVIKCPVCDKEYWVQGGYKPYYTSCFSEEELYDLD